LKILIVNGPNLNLLGARQPEIYGSQTFTDYFKVLQVTFPNHELSYYQSNVEGELINKLHDAAQDGTQGIVLNAGAYTHTSVAIGDAVAGIAVPVVEVHISNVMDREAFRHVSYISKHAAGVISGFGLNGYALGILSF
jgi:3-dehydroquinate dehydratase-2